MFIVVLLKIIRHWKQSKYETVTIQGTWVAQSVECLSLAQTMISRFLSLNPTSGSLLSAQSPHQALHPPLTAPSTSLSLSKVNIKKKQQYILIYRNVIYLFFIFLFFSLCVCVCVCVIYILVSQHVVQQRFQEQIPVVHPLCITPSAHPNKCLP